MISKIKVLFNMYKSAFYKRDGDIWIFGAWLGGKYADNSKYLYLKALKMDINATWITKKEEIYDQLKNKNLPVEMSNSERGIKLQKSARYAVYCVGPYDFDEQYLGGCTMIYLDHGIPIKKICYDDTVTQKQPVCLRKFKEKILRGPCFKQVYKLCTSPRMASICAKAYGLKKDHIIISGQPRNDIFFTDEYGEESDFSFIANKKVISYLPTHRREGNTEIDLEKILDLKQINKICSENNYIFVIKKHYYHKNEQADLEQFDSIIDITQSNVDTQELLKHTDVLITDYSSVYIDYLLLDRPIIFYNYDIDDYLINDRELYFDYNSVTPGAKITNKDELLEEIKKICLRHNDNYKKERKECIALFFDGKKKPCAEEIIGIIKNI